MRSSSRVVIAYSFALLATGCSKSSTDPTSSNEPVPSLSLCATDFSCGFGYECVDGTCVPIEPALRSHIQTGIATPRSPIDASESEWAALHYDLMIGGWDPDELRAINPNIRLFSYSLIRHHRFESGTKTASAWAVANGWNPEDFYLHYREDTYVPTWEGRVIVPGFPAGMVPGWNPGGGGNPASATQRSQARVVEYYNPNHDEPWCFANVAHPGYREFMVERIAGLMDGTWYHNQHYATGPMDGILCDDGIYYAMFGEGQLNRSAEYYGIPLNENHPYAITLENFYPFLAERLLGRLGQTSDLLVNYGHVLFLNYPNHSAISIQSTTPWALGEVWLTYTGTSSPTSGGNRCITYERDYENAVRSIIEQTRARGRRVLGTMDLSSGASGSERGRLFTLGVYYLLHNSHTYYMYQTVEQSNNPLSEWAWNSAAEFNVGLPETIPNGRVDFEGHANTKEHWLFASGADPYAPSLTYQVFARQFSNALVLVKMLPEGSVEDTRSVTVHPLGGPYRVLQADGNLGVTVTEARIRNNEALILVPQTVTGTD